MTNWLLSLLMLAALASGDVLRTQDQTQDRLHDGSCCTCPCK